MNSAFYFSAFTIGFLGSFHCAGMCGPLSLLIPVNAASGLKIFSGKLIYNAGRVVTYMILGTLFGLLSFAIALKGFQRELSITTGLLLLLTSLITIPARWRLKLFQSSNLFDRTIRKAMKKLFSVKSNISLFMIGMLNGLLPCGFVYLAIAGAAAAGSVSGGIMFMAFFGLGTFPMMMIISIAANYSGIKFKSLFSKGSSIITIILALFLIYRGTSYKTENCCHDKRSTAATINCSGLNTTETIQSK